jgi:hypothetical protein
MILQLANHADSLQVTTSQSLAAVTEQIAENQVDLPVAVAANQQQGTTGAVQGLDAVKGTLSSSSIIYVTDTS